MISKAYLSLAVILIIIGCILNGAAGDSTRDSFLDGPSSKAEEKQDLLLINKLKALDKWQRMENQFRKYKQHNSKYFDNLNADDDTFESDETSENLRYLKRGLKNVGYGFGRR
jgi:hypothetical protein